MSSRKDQLMVILKKGKQRLIAKTPLPGVSRVIVVVNRQYTNAPSTTQIASGAGHSSAAGSNAAIRSPYVRQQQSVGAGGKAFNKDGKGGLMGGAVEQQKSPRYARLAPTRQGGRDRSERPGGEAAPGPANCWRHASSQRRRTI